MWYHQIYVYFAPAKLSITSSAMGNGTISPTGTIYVTYGNNQQEYIFTPDHGHKVKDVIINNNSIGACNQYTFNNITSNQSIQVVFEEQYINIMFTSNDRGYLDYSKENMQLGSYTTFTITPKDGYTVSQVLVNNQSVYFDNNQFTILISQEVMDIEVVFVEKNSTPSLFDLDKKTIALIFGAIIIGLLILVRIIKVIVGAKKK